MSLVGQRFGALQVTKHYANQIIVCLCECGTTYVALPYKLTASASCPECTRKEWAQKARLITHFVANECGCIVADLSGRSRVQPLVHFRHLAMWLIRKETGASFPEIAKAFGRDHTTVIHAIKTTDDRMRNDRDWGDLVNDLVAKLKAQSWFASRSADRAA